MANSNLTTFYLDSKMMPVQISPSSTVDNFAAEIPLSTPGADPRPARVPLSPDNEAKTADNTAGQMSASNNAKSKIYRHLHPSFIELNKYLKTSVVPPAGPHRQEMMATRNAVIQAMQLNVAPSAELMTRAMTSFPLNEMTILLKAGGEVHLPLRVGSDAAAVAANLAFKSALQTFLDHGTAPSGQVMAGAVKNMTYEQVSLLIRLGGDLGYINTNSHSNLLHLAMERNNQRYQKSREHGDAGQVQFDSAEETDAIARLLMENGVSLTQKDNNDATPFHYAVRTGDVGATKAMIAYSKKMGDDQADSKIDINAKSKYGYSAMQMLVASEMTSKPVKAEMMGLLIENGLDITSRTFNNGYTSLAHELAIHGDQQMLDVVKDNPLFLAMCIKLDASRQTPIWQAVGHPARDARAQVLNKAMFDFLINLPDVNINQVRINHETILDTLSDRSEEQLAALLDHGAELHDLKSKGITVHEGLARRQNGLSELFLAKYAKAAAD